MAKDESTTGTIWRLAPLLAGAIALAAAVAFYMGWAYEKAYVEEWGLNFSAFSYTPYELMVRSTTTVFWAALTPVGAIIGVLIKPEMDRVSGGPPKTWERVTFLPLLFGTFAFLAALAAVEADWSECFLWLWIIIVSGGGLAWGYRTISEFAGRLFLLFIVFGVILIVLVPGILGRDDAKKDREDPDRLPLVTVTFSDAASTDLAATVNDPWRLIRVNNGNLWLAPDEKDSDRVIQIDDESVDSVTYVSEE